MICNFFSRGKHLSFFLAFAVIVLSFQLTGCHKEASDKVELTFWAMGAEGEQVVKLIPEFEKLHPNIKIKAQQIPWTAAHEKLITSYAGGTMPDCFQMGNTWLPEFASLECLEPLEPFVSNSSFVKKENYFKGIWYTNVIDSTLFGIPWYVDTRVLFYRTDVLNSVGYSTAPKTWDELYDVSKKIVSKQSNRSSYALFLPVTEYAPFVILGLQAGSDLLKENNTYGNFSGEKFIKAMRYSERFYAEKLAPIGMSEVNNIYQAFAEGYFSMFISGPWNVTEMKKRLPAHLQDKWNVAPLPSCDSIYPGVSLPGGASLSISKFSKHKREAWLWIEFLSSKETQKRFYNIISALPAYKEVWNEPELKNDKYLPVFFKQLERTQSPPKITEWEQIAFSKLQQYIEYIASKKMTVEIAMRNFDKDADRILEKRRWLLSKEKGGH